MFGKETKLMAEAFEYSSFFCPRLKPGVKCKERKIGFSR